MIFSNFLKEPVTFRWDLMDFCTLKVRPIRAGMSIMKTALVRHDLGKKDGAVPLHYACGHTHTKAYTHMHEKTQTLAAALLLLLFSKT